MEEKIRIQKFLSQNSICSRREAEKLINEKKIEIKKGEGSLPVKKKDDYEKDY